MARDVNVRALVLEMLLLITRDGKYSHIVLKNTLDQYQDLTKQERSFLTRVTMGTLENMIRIDWCINRVSSVKVNRMKPVIRTILRSSVYELLFLDHIPASATVNEAVKLAEKKGFRNLKGFVNGVLRTISRSPESLVLPKQEEDSLQYLSLTYSMPEWITEQFLDQYGPEKTQQILAAFLADSRTSVRFDEARIGKRELIRRLEEEGVQVSEIPDVSCGLYLSGYDYLDRLASFRDGLFYVQDVSSMQAVLHAGVEKGMHVMDVCAAPGGKALHMAELLDGTGLVEARDLTPAKVALIEENIERMGLSNIRAACQDAAELRPEDVETADLVLADLPCSGLGVIGRKPDIKYHLSKEKQQELCKLQQRILSVVSRYVRPGGILMYSTCTINRQENEENIRCFLASSPQFAVEEEKLILPEAGKNDGFYYCRLRRTDQRKA